LFGRIFQVLVNRNSVLFLVII